MTCSVATGHAYTYWDQVGTKLTGNRDLTQEKSHHFNSTPSLTRE